MFADLRAKFTLASLIPFFLDKARSILDEQETQCMPVMCKIIFSMGF